MKVFLDDVRNTPEGWVRVYWPDEAIELLKSGDVTHISLDHDLGDDDRGTGDDVVTWLQEQVYFYNMKPPVITVHSDNGPGIQKMRSGIERLYEKYDELQHARNKS